jgi:4-hydroxy-tetrahydrodipicolinate synthase
LPFRFYKFPVIRCLKKHDLNGDNTMFKGSYVALITPFSDGQVDEKALKQLVEWHIVEGTHGIVPVGTTGESPTLSHEEHDHVVKTVVDTAAGRVPVIAGAGSNSTAESLRLTESAMAAGADGALVVTPYYNKPTQRGLLAHFEAVAEIGIPIIIYNIPPRSVIDMVPETMGQLAKHKNIVGVKDATGDLARVCAQRLHCGEDFIQMSGEDATAHGFNAQGGVGCISVTANVAPKLCSQLQEATLAGDYATALKIQDKLMPLHGAVFTEPGLIGAKYGVSQLGKCTEDVRLPLTILTDETKVKMRSGMLHAGLIN